MNPLIESRLSAIQQSLLAHYHGGAGLPSAVIGDEREVFYREYLEKVLPPTLRIGKGCITDSSDRNTGQVDLVLEYPFGPSFPMPGSANRLYMAESIAAVIEVKSDLSKQWDEVRKTVKAVKPLKRSLRKASVLPLVNNPEPIFDVDESRVYCYAVGYTGHETIDGLQSRLDSTPEAERPDGALVISSGCFVGNIGMASGPWGLFALLAELTTITNAILGICHPIINDYGAIARR